jgi:bacteriochlorophyll 4-vinyl reductase
MNRMGVGRMLIASLHQGISDLMPTRLEFYENWLNPTGMRDGKIGLAPLAAVLSFLRQEGEPYTLVTQRAGEYAAQWTFDNLSPLQRSLIRAMPVALRTRVAMQVAKKVVTHSYHGSRAVTKFRRGEGTLTLRSSVFCTVREPFDLPLCVFYSAALSHLLTLVEVSGNVRVNACQGVGDAACVIGISVPTNQK